LLNLYAEPPHTVFGLYILKVEPIPKAILCWNSAVCRFFGCVAKNLVNLQNKWNLYNYKVNHSHYPAK